MHTTETNIPMYESRSCFKKDCDRDKIKYLMLYDCPGLFN